MTCIKEQIDASHCAPKTINEPRTCDTERLEREIFLKYNQSKWRATLALWAHNARSRRTLRKMTPDERRALGRTDAEIYHEYSKPFWRR